MKMKRNIFVWAAAAVLAAVATGCSVNEVEENIFGSFPYLELEAESMNIQKTASTGAIGFDSNRNVSLNVQSPNGTWLTARVEGDQIVMDWEQNELETSREATITVSTPNSLVVKKLEVTQDPSGELTLRGNLLLRNKKEIEENTYTKTTGDLLVGDIVYTRADYQSDFNGRGLSSLPTDISDSDIAKLTEQIHLIDGRGLAIVNTQISTFPTDIIKANGVKTVCLDYNGLPGLPSAEVMASMNLGILSLKGNNISDISALAGNNSIAELDLSGNDIYDLTPLTTMSALGRVVLNDLPLTATQMEIFREKNKNFDIVCEESRPEESPLPVFGEIKITEIADSQVQLKVDVVRNAGNVTKAGFYIGKKRLLSEMTYHDATYSAGTLTLVYKPESLHNMIYHVRAYAANDKGEGYSESSYFGSLTSEQDILIKKTSDLKKLFDDSYSHVNASVLIGNFSSSSASSAIRLNDGKYDYYFHTTNQFSDLTYLKSLVFIRDGLYIGNVGMKDVSAISHIKGIQTLWLRGNSLTSVSDLASSETLTYLDVSMNKLSDFSFLAKFPNLKKLYLGSSDKPEKETNDIGLLDGLENYKNLEFIDLSGLPLHQWQVDDLKAKMPETEIVYNAGGKDPWIPTIATKRVTRKGETVTLNGYVTSKGKSDIIEHGFYYGKDINNLEKVVVGEAVETGASFSTTLNIYDLDTYYYYAYAKNASGESRTSTFYEFSLAYMDLSQNGTANCYIVQTPGQYKFDASVRGNSVESVGAPASAEIVWQFTNPGQSGAKLINYTNLNGNYVEFEVDNDAAYGNALIAVKDASGTILWSWHIWICDFDPDLTCQRYSNGNAFMDRNLGATYVNAQNEENRRRSEGLFYQWGRKDPLTGGHFTVSGSFSSLEEAHANPDAIGAEPWVRIDEIRTLWGEDKTQYDPCPSGWKVPGLAAFEGVTSCHDTGMEVYVAYDGTNTAYYPRTSYWTQSGEWIDDFSGFYWTSYYEGGVCAIAKGIRDGFADFGRSNSDANVIRCVKDVGFTVSTGDFDVMSEYAVLSGNVKYNDATPVTDRGFVWSSTTSEPTLSNATSVASGAGDGDYTATITGLKPETTYYVRAYATGGNVTKYSRMVEIITKKSGSGDDFTEDDYEWE